ncbi:MAG: 4Fe-4S dicluster domain-containing protein [Chloroflexi bacterium]|nr:4Fe-4S dicluster domain-containing protein [Chloroflexota bacterium]
MAAAEREALRQRFLDEARAAVQAAHPLAASEQLPEAALANLADPTGQRAVKLQAAVPRPAAAPRQAAQVAPPVQQNVLVRMQQDLQRALQKPIEQRRWAMAIDLRKCIGCSACTVACKAENKLPPGVVYRPVVEEEVGTYPNVSRRFTPRPCMQCENPPCVPVCPVSATYQRPDGIVEIDYNACIGCRYCIAACPYGARTFDWGENYTSGTPRLEAYEQKVSFEYGQSWSRENGQSPVGNVRKCQFCVHRLEAGMLPACTTTCVGGATYFGDANDPRSLVSELISRPNTMRLKEELGTRPKVYYVL